MEKRKDTLWSLFSTFAKMGAVTFGGGYAMLPILEREVVEKHEWCTEEEILDYFAVGQCTPGIIAVNTATFIGYKTRGIMGGIAATLGMVFPSLVIISVIWHVLEAFQSNIYVKYALSGIQLAVAALITQAVFKLMKKSIVDRITAAIAAISLITMLLFDISPIIFIILGIGLGLFVNLAKNGRDKKNGEADR